MFQSLRPNNQIFILHKDKPYLEIGSVLNVSIPVPKYPMQPMMGQPQEMTVDIVARVNNQDVTYQKIPANLDVADFGNNSIVLAVTREAMNSEIMGLKQKSVDIINSIDYHKNLITECDKILTDLNPEFAAKQQQQGEIDDLKLQVKELSSGMASLMEMNKQLIAKLNGETLKSNNYENVGN